MPSNLGKSRRKAGYFWAVAGCTVACVLAGCKYEPAGNALANVAPDGTGRPKYRVVTTVAMVSDIVRQVAGERAELIGLLGEGVDPHLYKPTSRDVRKLTEADLIFYSGLLLEGRMQDTFERISGGGKPVFAVTSKLDESYLVHPPEFEGHPDPHVWMDVSAWSRCVEFVAERLGDFDPVRREEYQTRAEAYRAELARLDDYIRQGVASIPKEQRVLITAHDAFGYFGRAYGIEVRAPQGISTESEAGVEDINSLVDLIVGQKIRALFVESSVNPKTIHAVIEGAGARGHKVTIGGELFSDAMGAAGTYEGTYVGMMDHNATTIIRALGGDVPNSGLSGRLAK